MRRILTVWFIQVLLLPSAVATSQGLDRAMEEEIDAVIQSAYRTAASSFPCRIKTRGKPKTLRWEEVDRCLNRAASEVDWGEVAARLDELRRRAARVSSGEFAAAVESSLSAHTLTYEQVFAVKDTGALLPLTNSLLKFLPADSLQDLPVYDKAGTHVGAFLGTYSYERTGGLASANTYKLTLFQYTDRNGNVQPVGDKLLLDSFGVPWKGAVNERGFRLSSDLMRADK